MRKLLILPGDCETFGGALVSLSLLATGFERNKQRDQLYILVRAGSVMEHYLKKMGQEHFLQVIPAENKKQFFSRAIEWLNKQPKQYPLLLDSCVNKDILPILLLKAPTLRFSKRPIYHFCHDTAASGHMLGYIARKLIFNCLSSHTLCNSHFTAKHVKQLMPNICGVLYQPVDTQRFNNAPLPRPPLPLEAILNLNFRTILIPSRISDSGISNDKNLHAYIALLAVLKAKGHNYCGVVIGEDSSPRRINSHNLKAQAKAAGVADRFFVLPPATNIESYYKFADVVAALAPREPFGRTVIEAIACNVPVIGSSTGGIGEILSHFAQSWMVAPDDPTAAAEAIIRISIDSNTSTILANAQKWVEAECSVEIYSKRMAQYTNLSMEKAHDSQSKRKPLQAVTDERGRLS